MASHQRVSGVTFLPSNPANKMHTELKSVAFVQTLGQVLQMGYALMPASSTADGASSSTTACCAVATHRGGDASLVVKGEAFMSKLLPIIDTLSPSCFGGIKLAETHCGELVTQGALECMKLFDTIDDVAEFQATVPHDALVFFGSEIPAMSIADYLAHIIPCLHCSEEAIIMAVVYIARAVKTGVPFTPRSAHRMIAAAILIAVKTHDEQRYPIRYYANLVGLHPSRLVLAEMAMLQVLNFATFVSPAEYVLTLFSFRSCHVQVSEQGRGVRWSDVMHHVTLPPRRLFEPNPCPVLIDGEDDAEAMIPLIPTPSSSHLSAPRRSLISLTSEDSENTIPRSVQSAALTASMHSSISNLA